MSTEVHKYIEDCLEKNENLFNAEVINFPIDQKLDETKNSEDQTYRFWKISDKSNDDQLKAVIGVCFMLITLVIMGLYSNFF